jgi:hypothetical protein
MQRCSHVAVGQESDAARKNKESVAADRLEMIGVTSCYDSRLLICFWLETVGWLGAFCFKKLDGVMNTLGCMSMEPGCKTSFI